MQKWIFFVLFILAGALGLGVLFKISPNAKRRKQQSQPAAKFNSLRLLLPTGNLMLLTTRSKRVSLPKFPLSLKEGVHAVEIKGLDIKLDKENPSKEITFDKPGTYEIECVLPCGEGHTKMKSKLVVQ